MSAALAVQKALRARLIASPSIVGLVPAAAILDRNQRPAPSPSIVLGEAQEIDEGADLGRRLLRVFSTLHIWKREPSLEGVTVICALIRMSIRAGRLQLGEGLHCVDVRSASMRTLRDPDGETSHGVVTIETLVEEVE